MPTLTYTKRAARKGSTQVSIDVSRNDGRPFGAIWTFRNTRDTWHPWHAKPLNGEHRTFWNAAETGGDLAAAKAYLETFA